jgi:hypothetical protein
MFAANICNFCLLLTVTPGEICYRDGSGQRRTSSALSCFVVTVSARTWPLAKGQWELVASNDRGLFTRIFIYLIM